MKRKTTNKKKKGGGLYMLLLFLMLGNLYSFAQTVTISPQTGHLIASYTTSATEHGFTAGFCAMWKHEQAPLTYTTSDAPSWSNDGTMLNHTCMLRSYNDKIIQIAGYYPSYACLAMPKGYRITSYKIVIANNLSMPADKTVLDDAWGTVLPFARINAWTFGEVNRSSMPTGLVYAVPAFRADAKVSIPTTSYGQEFTVQRSGEDLGNVIYFGFNGNTGYNKLAGITIKSFEITFVADKAIDVAFDAGKKTTTKVSLIESDFPTGKVDIGGVFPQEKDGKTYFAYNPNEIDDATAKLRIYEEGAHSNGTWDETQGQKLISSIAQNGSTWLAMRTGTYYAETPTTINLKTGNGVDPNIPIGYRVVGATLSSMYGASSTAGGGFAIKGTNNDYSTPYTYYLQYNGSWGNTQQYWYLTNEGQIYTVYNGTRYYLIYSADANDNSIAYIQTHTNGTSFKGWRITSDGSVYYLSNSNHKYYIYLKYSNSWYAYMAYKPTADVKSTVVYRNSTFTPSKATIEIFDKTGTTVAQTLRIDGTNPTTIKSISLNGLNNDAIKFRVTTDTPDADALVRLNMMLEPLNPYIYSVDAVCNDSLGEEVKHTLTGIDFKLNGNTFEYKVPSGFSIDEAQFSFRNLISNSGDNTYLHHPTSGNSRYNFVGSIYNDAVNGDLYTNKAIVADYDYTAKIATEVVGNIPFVFNNSADLSNTQTSSTTKYLREYPFSKATYSTNADANGTPGSLSSANAIVKDGETKSMHLFTTDETRYNIAPTYNEMHRYFAYYNTNVKLNISYYNPIVTWEPVYDKTFYLKNGVESTDKMVGAVLTTTDTGYSNGSYGYLSVSQVKSAMEQSIAEGTAPNVPKSMEQVLYVDNSKLLSLLSKNPDGIDSTSVKTLRGVLAKNSLVYLPAKAANIVDDNNIAVMQGAQNAIANTNIIIEDKQPFFAKYDIQISPTNYASYIRQITTASYTNGSTFTTLALPFGLSIDANGQYTDNESGSQFTLSVLAPTNSLSAATGQSGQDYLANATFNKITPNANGLSEPNMPYLAQITSGLSDGNGLFVAKQQGALIARSTTSASNSNFVGTTSSGAWNNQELSITSNSSYAGNTFDKTANGGVFYFSKDKFVALANLKSDTLKMFPYRAHYQFESAALPAKMFTAFNIIYGDDTNSTTSINGAEADNTLSIYTGKGSLTLQAMANQMVRINHISGQNIMQEMINAGQSKTILLPAGVYIVNSTKVIIR